MKKYFWLAFAIVALFISCSKTDEFDMMIGTEDFTGSIAETRAELDGAAVLWNMGDEVTIFTKTAHNRQYRVKDLSNGNRSATFGYVGYTGEDGTAISSKYAVYPYDVNASLSGDVITTMFNGEQVYNAEKVDLVNALMVAKSQTTALQFVNAASLLRFNVKKNIPDNYTLQSIKLTSASNKLSGEVTIDLASDSKAVVASTGSNEISLTGINTVITQEEQSLYIALPTTTFAANDLSVTITFDEDVKVFKLPAFDLACGAIKTIAYTVSDSEDFTGTTPDGEEDFEGETPGAAPANNEIWYTSTDDQAYEYFTIDASGFGANLVSNEYVDGKGILTFDGNVTGVYFDGLNNIETLTLPASVEDGFLRYCNNLKQINGCLASEDGRCLVVDGVVKGFAPSGLTEYTFPQGITKIGGVKDSAQTAVLGCAATIMKFVFPEGLTEIGYYAFGERLNDGASSGLVVELPSTLTTIADNAFCVAGLEQITLPANLKTIGNNAFNYNSLTSVVVPSNVTSIGDGAFGSNSELSSVTVEATSPCSIGSNVFSECSDALNINVPSDNWKAYAYDDSWGEYAYYMRVDGEVPAFDKIPSFQIWYTTSDGKECQLYDTEVFGATLVSNIYENGKGVIAFNGAVAQIGLCAFYGNTAARQTLTSITIPAFVRSIGKAAIANHPNLTAIYCTRTTPPTGADDMFLKDNYSTPYDGTIYVPTASVDAYKAAAYWSEYADKIVGYDFE